jgi:hypothetical protein
MLSEFDHAKGMFTSRHVICGVDGRPCEVMLPIERALPASRRRLPLLERFVEYLPCDRCRMSERDATGLAGVRLGCTERALLLRAAPTSAMYGSIVAREDGTRAAHEADFRASRKLVRAGLVQEGRMRTTVRYRGHVRAYVTRTAWRSPLGDEIVVRYMPELESGRRIRWDRRVVEAAQAVRRDVGGLVHDFACALREKSESLARAKRTGRATAEKRNQRADLRTLVEAVEGVGAGMERLAT